MSLFNEVVIGLKCVDLSQGIMFIWNKQHQLPWMWLWDVSFWMCARCYLLVYYCSRFKIVRHGRITYIIVHQIILLLWMTKMSHPWLLPLHFFCILCEQFTRVAIMLICNQCSRGWHMGCFTLPLEEVLMKKCFCP